MRTHKHPRVDERSAGPRVLALIVAALCCITFFVGFLLNEGSLSAARSDFFEFHLPSIQVFRHLPWSQAVRNYPSATMPLFAMVESLNPWVDQLFYLRASYAALCFVIFLIFVWTLNQRFPSQRTSAWAWVAGGALLLSPYFRAQSFWPMTDNFALLFLVATAALLQKVGQLHKQERPSSTSYTLAALLPVLAFGAFYTRQTYAFLPVYVMGLLFWKLPKFRWCSLSGIVAGLPALYLVAIWHGLTPPGFQQHHQGFAFAQISFPPAICAFCSIPFVAAAPQSFTGTLRRKKLLLLCSLIAVPCLIAGVSAFHHDFVPNYAGIFSNFLYRFQAPGMIVYLAFVAAGVFLLGGLISNATPETRFLMSGFLLPYLTTPILFERYFDPIVMVTALLLFSPSWIKRYATPRAAYILAGFQLLLLAGSLLHRS